ncbi:hypothetical protein CEXT_18531 [Caerostris extrusa]|uniref:Uncharacterized protein n=1 Tax=Caerostris extrusa TaxID=172846 RepID=A0AAV4RIY9_CAEEX|nr:hypothetical protein CEXT_18531 [Caerostris extrusa]
MMPVHVSHVHKIRTIFNAQYISTETLWLDPGKCMMLSLHGSRARKIVIIAMYSVCNHNVSTETLWLDPETMHDGALAGLSCSQDSDHFNVQCFSGDIAKKKNKKPPCCLSHFALINSSTATSEREDAKLAERDSRFFLFFCRVPSHRIEWPAKRSLGVTRSGFFCLLLRQRIPENERRGKIDLACSKTTRVENADPPRERIILFN